MENETNSLEAILRALTENQGIENEPGRAIPRQDQQSLNTQFNRRAPQQLEDFILEGLGQRQFNFMPPHRTLDPTPPIQGRSWPQQPDQPIPLDTMPQPRLRPAPHRNRSRV